jgi:hypothetical protein
MKLWTIAIVLMASAHIASAQTGQKAAPGAQAPQSQSHWITDPKTGCRLWDPMPEPEESVSWSGGCKDGLAQGAGVAQWYSKGQLSDRYEGDYLYGWEHGHGVYQWKSNGDRYEGNYLQNLRDGQGTYRWADGRSYTGAWDHGKAHGQGRFVAADGKVSAGQWIQGCFNQGGLKANVGVTRAECGFSQ